MVLNVYIWIDLQSFFIIDTNNIIPAELISTKNIICSFPWNQICITCVGLKRNNSPKAAYQIVLGLYLHYDKSRTYSPHLFEPFHYFLTLSTNMNRYFFIQEPIYRVGWIVMKEDLFKSFHSNSFNTFNYCW